jgi:hypothetical protein
MVLPSDPGPFTQQPCSGFVRDRWGWPWVSDARSELYASLREARPGITQPGIPSPTFASRGNIQAENIGPEVRGEAERPLELYLMRWPLTGGRNPGTLLLKEVR